MPIRASRRWILPDPAPADLIADTPEHALLVQTLFRRGYTTPAAISAFLADGAAASVNPFALSDMDRAVERIVRAIDAQEIICVYGDFDADGVTATALLAIALQAAGAKVGVYIPERVDEGYGLNLEAIGRVAQKANLIVTVDCGMRSLAEVAHANALGVDVVITDHHSLGDVLPAAVAVVNPRRQGCPDDDAQLSGVGVAYRLAQAVLRTLSERPANKLSPQRVDEIEEELLDLVALGTVADMMALTGTNRRMVQQGLQRMRLAPRPGIAALLEQSSTPRAALDAQAIAFRLAPRINAAGRLAHATIAYQLLRTNDSDKARGLAQELEVLNRQRQNLTVEAQSEAELQIAEQRMANGADAHANAPFLYMVQSQTIRSGIVGLVAGKVVERHYRPAVVIEQGAEESRGSARSISEFDIGAALDELSAMLVRHGGHSRAAGFTIRSDALPELRSALGEIAARELAGHEELQPTIEVDAVTPLHEVGWGLLNQFMRLEPTGQENPQPLLLSENVRVRSARSVGEGRHLKLVLDDGWGMGVLDGIAFGMGEHAASLREGERLDIVYSVERNDFGGNRILQLNIRDLRTP